MATVLVVDDRPTNRKRVVMLLKSNGHRPLEASDGAEALRLAHTERPELVISDILMPTMDGFEFVRRLRAAPELAKTHVIFYTAQHHEREARALMESSGVSRVLIKPCSPKEILRAIEETLRGERRRAPPPTDEEFDREHLRVVTDRLAQKVEELTAANKRLDALTDVNLQLAAERDPRTALQSGCRDARELVGARHAVLSIRDKSESQATFPTTSDITQRKRAEDEVHRLNADLERRVAERTAELEAANRELEAFDYSISHDLRAPLNRIEGFSAMLGEQYGDKLDAHGKEVLQRIAEAGRSMDRLVGDLFTLSTATRGELRRSLVDVGALAQSIVASLRKSDPGRDVRFDAPAGMSARADPGLLGAVLENLLGNAWKFTSRRAQARIEMGCIDNAGERAFFVRDNGAGFDMANAGELFIPFRRMHSHGDFEGTGIGLATVQRIVRRHGGRVWAEASADRGATFFFTLSA